MAHLITSKDHMVSGNGILPWHKIGTVVNGLLTAREALQKAHLDFDVSKEEIYYGNGNRIKDKYAMVRKDTGDALGIVGKRYTPIQNVDGLDILDPVIGSDAVYETAGSLNEGRIVWFLAKLNKEYFLRFDDDRCLQYCLVFLSHDGSKPVTVRFTRVRVCCNNTLSAAMNGSAAEVTIRHTGNYKNKIEQAHEIMRLADKNAQEFASLMTKLDSQKIGTDEARKLISRIIPEEGDKADEAKEDIFSRFRGGIGNLGQSRADLLNGVTEYTTHRKLNTRKNHDEKRMSDIFFGSGNSINARALSVITAN